MPTSVCASNVVAVCRSCVNGLDIGLGAEQHQRNAVAVPPRDEIGDHALDAGEPRQHRAIARAEIGLVHRSGDVHREHEIPRGYFTRDGIADPLRPRQRCDDKHPDHGSRYHLDSPPLQHDGAALRRLAGCRRKAVEEWNHHRGLPCAIRRQQPPHQDRQRQDREYPGPCELKHGAP
ncbi:hypothetical protein ACVIYL_004821 [Bradyrhizobium sp. USDA 3315]